MTTCGSMRTECSISYVKQIRTTWWHGQTNPCCHPPAILFFFIPLWNFTSKKSNATVILGAWQFNGDQLFYIQLRSRIENFRSSSSNFRKSTLDCLDVFCCHLPRRMQLSWKINSEKERCADEGKSTRVEKKPRRLALSKRMSDNLS